MDKKQSIAALQAYATGLAVSHEQVPILQQLVLSLQDDFKTYDIMKAYALDEEEDMLWSETQLDLIGKIGLQNWLVKQL